MEATRKGRTRNLLAAVASNGTDDGILLAADAVDGALSVALGLGGVIFGLALDVLLLAGLLPARGTGKVADGLDGITLDGVILASGLAVERAKRQ